MNLLSINNFLKHNNYYSGSVLINNTDPIEGTNLKTIMESKGWTVT
jgi:hypothetical protein